MKSKIYYAVVTQGVAGHEIDRKDLFTSSGGEENYIVRNEIFAALNSYASLYREQGYKIHGPSASMVMAERNGSYIAVKVYFRIEEHPAVQVVEINTKEDIDALPPFESLFPPSDFHAFEFNTREECDGATVGMSGTRKFEVDGKTRLIAYARLDTVQQWASENGAKLLGRLHHEVDDRGDCLYSEGFKLSEVCKFKVGDSVKYGTYTWTVTSRAVMSAKPVYHLERPGKRNGKVRAFIGEELLSEA